MKAAPQLAAVKKESFYIAYFSGQGRSQFLPIAQALTKPACRSISMKVGNTLTLCPKHAIPRADSAEVAVKARYILGMILVGRIDKITVSVGWMSSRCEVFLFCLLQHCRWKLSCVLRCKSGL